jgi:signal transduction histidine kinase
MATEQETARAGGGIAARQGCFNWRFALNDAPRHKRRLTGRLAAMFFTGSGALGLAALPVPASRLNVIGAVALSAVAFALGVAEGVAWTAVRQEKTELDLRQEKDRTERLRELDEMKDKFLSSVSHELRNPITICRGHLDVLDEDADKQELRAVKETLITELDLMARLVEDLITLARVDDRTQLRVESLPLDGFVSGIAKSAEALLGDRLRVESEVTGQTLRADPQRLTQALLNLLRNAVEHARGERPVLFRVRAEPSSWRFEVTDEGGGLAPGAEEVVFEPFRTGSPGTGGTGLGLSIVRGVAKAHGGQAGVINRPGQGATFWIRIPR